MNNNIDDTPFTVDFVIDKLKSSGFDCSKDLLNDFDAEDITHGSAFFSRIFRLKFSWKNEKIKPKSIILKVPGVQQVGKTDFERDESTLEYLEFCHTNEYQTYNFLFNESKKLNLSIKIPNIYYGSDYSRNHKKGLIIMDDLSEIGGTLRLLPGLNNNQIEAVVDELAKIHFISWKNPYMIHNHPKKPNEDAFIGEMKNVADELRELNPDVFNPLMDKVDKLFSKEVLKYSYYDQPQYGFHPTMVHSDLWSANILFDKNDKGTIGDNLVAIIDWQGNAAGNPCVDIGRLLAVNTTSEYRRQNTKRLLERYMNKVEELMGGKAPFTFDQLLEAYDGSMGYVALFLGFGAPMYYHMPAVVGTDDSKKEEHRVELLDRTKCFFEDTLEAFMIRKFIN